MSVIHTLRMLRERPHDRADIVADREEIVVRVPVAIDERPPGIGPITDRPTRRPLVFGRAEEKPTATGVVGVESRPSNAVLRLLEQGSQCGSVLHRMSDDIRHRAQVHPVGGN